jgi:hypothetical protein
MAFLCLTYMFYFKVVVNGVWDLAMSLDLRVLCDRLAQGCALASVSSDDDVGERRLLISHAV